MAEKKLPAVEVDQDKWTPAEKSELAAKGYRALRSDEMPKICSVVRPSDYVHDFKRGTVDYKEGWPNYSYCKVRIPAGTVVKRCNFAQVTPRTNCIITDGPITLIDCNLCNVALDPSWTIQNCLTAQSWIVEKDDGTEDRQFICSHPSQLTGSEIVPSKVIISRNF